MKGCTGRSKAFVFKSVHYDAAYSHEFRSGPQLDDRSLFSRSLREADDDMPPFILPVQPSDPRLLEAVVEEDEDDDGMDIIGQEVEGGIRFSFAPITPKRVEREVPSLPALPTLADMSFTSFLANNVPKVRFF